MHAFSKDAFTKKDDIYRGNVLSKCCSPDPNNFKTVFDQVGGQAQLIEGVGDLTTFTGQAVIAAMREGRNQIGLQSVGITTNGPIPADPNPPPLQANLIPSTYTAQQAANIVVV